MESIKNGEGKIIDYKNQKIGVYKNEKGIIFAVSEKCTYDGCDLMWNHVKKVWLCPCCGSTYDIEGKVIRGPAKKNLEKINI